MNHLFWIGGFGVLGVLARYFCGVLLPFGTIFVNLLGSFLIGAIYVVASEKSLLNEEVRLGIMTGFLGGFTTFSAFCLEAFDFFEKGKLISGLAYFVLTPMVGLVFTYAGILVSRWWVR